MTRLIPFDGVYYCPWTGMPLCLDENEKCPEWEDCPIIEECLIAKYDDYKRQEMHYYISVFESKHRKKISGLSFDEFKNILESDYLNRMGSSRPQEYVMKNFDVSKNSIEMKEELFFAGFPLKDVYLYAKCIENYRRTE